MPAPIPGTTSTTSMATREEEGGASRRRQRPGSSPASEARRVSIPPDLSESAEIDSSRGLLGCARSQASSSPDLNIFYEPLLESLPAALHRSQLSEKAPRLRKKFRGSSRRVRPWPGPEPACPARRTLLHPLHAGCWDPKHAAYVRFLARRRASGRCFGVRSSGTSAQPESSRLPPVSCGTPRGEGGLDAGVGSFGRGRTGRWRWRRGEAGARVMPETAPTPAPRRAAPVPGSPSDKGGACC
ncbi:uncharacterized protein A4U43_C03F15070 [Asparagus officinalis]|uniref:Uncharacterized protein n=1 Tax=Asparagus officinalis TaxID=4686 RepID=A0A5P1FA71_ASPOF|nr:uncharacterized protein A4U43_C03F15070 [Asparagus officinalis]